MNSGATHSYGHSCHSFEIKLAKSTGLPYLILSTSDFLNGDVHLVPLTRGMSL